MYEGFNTIQTKDSSDTTKTNLASPFVFDLTNDITSQKYCMHIFFHEEVKYLFVMLSFEMFVSGCNYQDCHLQSINCT